jgi:aspartate aminotransferase-like enzyme
VPERVQVAMAKPLIHHRHAEFKGIFKEAIEGLKYFFQTAGRIIVLTSSGSGAMEACVTNLLCKGDTVLTINGGKFGERWGLLCKTYGADAHIVDVTWGTAIDPEVVKTFLLEHPQTSAVFVTHSETSTGVATDVKRISEIVHQHSDAILVVDSITSAGVLPFKMDEWGIDAAVTGSQKGLMLPPGLAVVALNDRAWKKVEGSDIPKYYFNLKKEADAQEGFATAWTPAITLIMGLCESLKIVREDGIENMWQKFARMAKATRAGMQAVELEIFAKDPSDSLTAVKVPDAIDGAKFVRHLREEYAVTVAGGQAQLKGKIFRVSHMGFYDLLDMVSAMSAVELALHDFDWEFERGAGVGTVQRVYMES